MSRLSSRYNNRSARDSWDTGSYKLMQIDLKKTDLVENQVSHDSVVWTTDCSSLGI